MTHSFREGSLVRLAAPVGGYRRLDLGHFEVENYHVIPASSMALVIATGERGSLQLLVPGVGPLWVPSTGWLEEA